MERFHQGQRVLVKEDENSTTFNREGTVTRICTDGERAWVLLDAKGGGIGTEKVRTYPSLCEPSANANRAERREAKRESAEPAPTLETFGRDHWSTFAYIETRIVDHLGLPNRDHMRCHESRHPLLVGRAGDGSGYPTRLRAGTLAHHDDWDCCDDLETAGLLTNIGTGVNPRYSLTDRGVAVASQLRAHLAAKRPTEEFVPAITSRQP